MEYEHVHNVAAFGRHRDSAASFPGGYAVFLSAWLGVGAIVMWCRAQSVDTVWTQCGFEQIQIPVFELVAHLVHTDISKILKKYKNHSIHHLVWSGTANAECSVADKKCMASGVYKHCE